MTQNHRATDMADAKPKPESKDRIPFDPIAVLISVRKRLVVLGIWICISIACGLGAGVYFGDRSWDSYCVLLYQPPSVELSGRVYESPVVQTQLNLVKLRPNLEETRALLALSIELSSLASSCDVTNPRDTQMLIVKCEWGDAATSAAVANTLSKAFVDAQTRSRNQELSDALEYLVGRKQMLANKLSKMKESAKQSQSKESVDLDREIDSYQTKLDALDIMYEKSLSDREAFALKVERVAALIEEIKVKIASEDEEAAAMEGLSNLNIRVERIRESIMDYRRTEINQARLDQAAQKLEQHKRLYEQNAVSKSEYQESLADYEIAKSQAVDSEQIKLWKDELNMLYAKIRPSDKKNAASAPVLRDLQLRAFNLELEFDGVNETIAKSKSTRDRMSKEMEALLESRMFANDYQWQAESWQEEIAEIDRSVAIAESLISAEMSDFQVVSPAAVSPQPTKSNRRLLAVGIAGFLCCLGLFVVLSLELVQNRVRTVNEVMIVVDEPVIGVLLNDPTGRTETEPIPANLEQVRSIANSLLQARENQCVLITGCNHRDGSSTVAAQVACCLARQQRNVAIIDGDQRSPVSGLSEIFSLDPNQSGLSELLNNGDGKTADFVQPVEQQPASILTRGYGNFAPEMFGSARMSEIVEDLKQANEYVLVDGPPLCGYSDAEFLTAHIDSILLVVRSASCSRSDLKRALERIRKTGKRLVGVVLNDVDPIWLWTPALK
jgi:capsular exopolysaccharide synthesis family protein